jgi:uncharacterized protein YrrD
LKKNSEILGLPVISITEGSELGRVKCLVINPLKGAIAAMVIEDDNWYKVGAKLLPFSAIIGVGENAITIENSTSIVPIINDPEIEKLLDKNIKVIGAKVITQRGSFQGRVIEYSVDESGIIHSCKVEDLNEGVSQIEGQRILTFGKEIMIISDDNISVAAESVVKVETFAMNKQSTIVPIIASEIGNDSISQSVVAKVNDNSAKKFEDKQSTYLIGKKVTRRIEKDNGVIIIDQGCEITKEIIQEAKDAGKLVEMSMNI